MTIFDDIKRDREAGTDGAISTCIPIYADQQQVDAFDADERRRARLCKLEAIALAAGKLAKAADQHGWHCNDIEFHDELLELLEICK